MSEKGIDMSDVPVGKAAIIDTSSMWITQSICPNCGGPIMTKGSEVKRNCAKKCKFGDKDE